MNDNQLKDLCMRIESGAVGPEAFALLRAYKQAVKDRETLQAALDESLATNLELEARLQLHAPSDEPAPDGDGLLFDNP